jgi:hypothetical protein
MDEREAEIILDLKAIAPDLIGSHGNRGYADWGTQLFNEIDNDLRSRAIDGIRFRMERIPLRASSSKSPDLLLALGGLSIAIGTAAGPADLTKVKQVFQGIWQALRKMLPRGTTIRLKSGSTTIDISTDTGDAAQSLLKASVDTLKSLQSPVTASNAKAKRAVTLSPNRR